ncbi:outer membrane protein OprM precursor [bacterium BMS3Abin07]|nr:outer membrane protein OprM precursor [bacterium BMS3Abin07]GBE32046.1 outer membrane protein OprM precursor [bacterium BMS3Bbin05]
MKYSLYSIIVLSVLLFVPAGCSIHKSLVSDNMMELPPSFTGYAGGKGTLSSKGKWWEYFGDESLNDLEAEALRNNPDIIRAYERINETEAILNKSRASEYPLLNINGSGGRSRQPGISGPSSSDSYSLSAEASYELDLWGKVKSEVDAGQFETQASVEDLKAAYLSVSAKLADLYYLAVELRAQLKLSMETIESFRNTLDLVKRRYRAGLVPAIDVYQSRQNLASARAQLPVFKSRLAVTLHALSVLVGRYPGSAVGGESDEIPEIRPFKVGIPSQLLRNRPDIKSAFLRLKVNDKRVASAVADRFPSFNLIGSYGGASGEVRTLLDSPNILWNLLLQITQPVIDGGRRRAEVRRSEAAFRESLAIYHKAVLNALRDVEDAIVNNSATEERINSLKVQVDATSASLRLAIDRYMQGLSDYIPVLTAQRFHSDAQRKLLAARRQLISDRISLARALGGGWMRHEINKRLAVDKNKGDNR